MKEPSRMRVTIFSFIVILICNRILPAFAGGEGNEDVEKQENPSLLEIIHGIFWKRFPPSSWELIQAAIQKIKMKIYHPNLDLRSKSGTKGDEEKGGKNHAGERVKEAAKEGLERSRETIEGSAKPARDAVSGAEQRTAEKVTNPHTKTEGSHDEI